MPRRETRTPHKEGFGRIIPGRQRSSTPSLILRMGGRIQCAAHVPPRSGKVRTVTDKKARILMYSLTRKAPRGMGERPKVSQNCFLRASCHFLSMPEHPCAVEERPGSVGMPSWGAPATPRECPRRSKECPGGSKIVHRSGPSHPRVTKNVIRTPPDAENHDFLKSMFYEGKTQVLGAQAITN